MTEKNRYRITEIIHFWNRKNKSEKLKLSDLKSHINSYTEMAFTLSKFY